MEMANWTKYMFLKQKYLVVCGTLFVFITIVITSYNSKVNFNSAFFQQTDINVGQSSHTPGIIHIHYANVTSLGEKLASFNRNIMDKVSYHVLHYLNGYLKKFSNLDISKILTNYTIRRGYIEGQYSYGTPVRDTLTFILSWKSSEFDKRTQNGLVEQTLPLLEFYPCVRGVDVGKLGGWVSQKIIAIRYIL